MGLLSKIFSKNLENQHTGDGKAFIYQNGEIIA